MSALWIFCLAFEEYGLEYEVAVELLEVLNGFAEAVAGGRAVNGSDQCSFCGIYLENWVVHLHQCLPDILFPDHGGVAQDGNFCTFEVFVSYTYSYIYDLGELRMGCRLPVPGKCD